MPKKPIISRLCRRSGAFLVLAFTVVNSRTHGIYSNGLAARSTSASRPDVASADTSRGTMSDGPAGLGFLDDVAFNVGMLKGHLNQPDVPGDGLDNSLPAFPNVAAAIPSQKIPVTTDVSVSDTEHGQTTRYTFQDLSRPADQTLVNPRASSVGWNMMAGLLNEAVKKVTFGMSYESPATVNTGWAAGNPYAQSTLQTGIMSFHYNAAAKNKFPEEISAGAAWKFRSKWRAALQVDWVGWSDAFNSLPVSVTGGNNLKLNSANVPLNWSDEFVYRAGLEYELTERIALRAGYAYGESPVPDSTLLPLTAGLVEHAFTAGIGYHWRRWQVDLAYQYALPATNAGAGQSHASGASNSSEASAQMVALTANVRF